MLICSFDVVGILIVTPFLDALVITTTFYPTSLSLKDQYTKFQCWIDIPHVPLCISSVLFCIPANCNVGYLFSRLCYY